MFDTYLEEEILDKIAIPHIVFPQDTLQQKRALSWYTLSLDGKTFLLASTFSFSYPSIITGISENSLEYIAKNAPEKYKRELFETTKKDYIQKEIFEIAKAMDEDLGENVTKNRERVKNVIQYIKDNRIVFEF